MAKSDNTTRIYLADEEAYHAFYWVNVGSDKSIYFGSSNAKKFKWGFSETVSAGIGGVKISPQFQGEVMDAKALLRKYSLHTSGVAYSPTGGPSQRNRYRSQRLDEYPDCMPLIGVLPMPLHLYPKSEKMIRSSDIVLDIKKFGAFPYAVLVYVNLPGCEKPKIIQNLSCAYPLSEQQSAYINDGLLVTAVAYSNPEAFTHWREDEYVATARPNEHTLEFRWPLFGST